MSNDERTMVERKLSGVHSTVTFDIPWEWYESPAREMKLHLEQLDIIMSLDEILNHPAVIADFNDSLARSMESKDWEWMSDILPNTESIFSKEIADKHYQDKLAHDTILQEQVAKYGPSRTLEIPTERYEEAMRTLKTWNII